ncbi:uncharacterized protein LOC143083637 [Mytilus galloprovincialis]|uniref:Uncharacterized protein n=2 Tax=Mytilus TaxID=6548 RepID=A0A8B6HKA8_MYTGA|nr:unnamed protein product [Mytilus edulis]VDI81318.1 Hypothetical predicted protein [Mytilus galloprovincialis]
MADGSIVKEAALRYQRRRPRPLIPVSRDESMEQSESSTTPLSLEQRTTESFTTVPTIQTLRRPKFVDRQLQFRNTAFCLPFIQCKFHTREAKALINTCVLSSIINRRLYQDLFFEEASFQAYDMARGVPFVINNRLIHFDFIIRGDVPDLVLGLDFFTQLECALDFGTRQFIVRQDPQVSTTLLCERELPLRYRNVHNLLASF